ncbi:MAG TPA: hypothetical protein VJ463_08670, partial [Geothrix sp.]|nr:hypothetical protein [Geothrix sp.]
MRNKITQFIISFAVSWPGFSSPPTLINPNHPDFWVSAIAESAQKNINVHIFEFDRKIDLIDMANGENGLLIAPGFLESKLNDTELDMLEGAWLSYAFSKSPQLSRNKSAFQSECDAILAYLQAIDQYVVKHKTFPKDKATIQLSVWRKNKDLKMAILFLMYRPEFEKELNDFLVSNPGSVSEFFRKYALLPNSNPTRLSPAPASRLLGGKIISTLITRIARTHDQLSARNNKFEKI